MLQFVKKRAVLSVGLDLKHSGMAFLMLHYQGSIHPLEEELANDSSLWQEIAQRHNLKELNLERLASPWHTDLDLGRPIEVMTDMSKSRKLGFSVFQSTEDSFYDLFTKLLAEKLIP
ncbi:hypothetical protein AAKU52_003262 [Pedobacter sp. CG_S7]|uniref:hypothetical protein n=1 Tax=Pedobacter sp. CG_S7 TaxID=3143930 RepID=UPI00339850EC